MRHGVVAVLGAALLLVGLAAAPARAAPPAPGFFGVAPQAALTEADLARMRGVVQTVRIQVNWAQIESRPGGYDFGALDAEVLAAAQRGIRVLPFIYWTPAWLSPDPARSPLRFRQGHRAWSAFLRRLVRRYGPGGTIWRGREQKQPIHRWQIWNEPNFRLFWHPRPSPVEYARLVAASARAIRGADPKAQIVLAGVAPVEGGLWPWVFLRRLYRVPGAKKSFDMVAVHPYAATIAKMSGQIRDARTVMAEAGDEATPLLISELGVASWSTFPSDFVKGADGQARFLRRAFHRLLLMRARWRLAGAYWFTWQDQPGPDRRCSFCQGAGLLDLAGRPKPAWWAFRQVALQAGERRVR